jgi:hypothetical protein
MWRTALFICHNCGEHKNIVGHRGIARLFIAVPKVGPDGPWPEAPKLEGPKLEGRQMKKIFYIKLLFTRILGFIWRPHGSKKEEMSLKISALLTNN